jgi:beta-lactamase class A
VNTAPLMPRVQPPVQVALVGIDTVGTRVAVAVDRQTFLTLPALDRTNGPTQVGRNLFPRIEAAALLSHIRPLTCYAGWTAISTFHSRTAAILSIVDCFCRRQLFAPLLVLGAPARAGQPGPRPASDRRIREAVSAFSGAVSLFAKNIETGGTYGIRENERVRTASTIKVAVMAAVFAAVAEGRARWHEELLLREADKVGGSGVVRELSAGVRLPLRDLVRLMIVVSDNTATNLLLDRFGGDAVNREMDKLGLRQTRVLRKILGGGRDVMPVPSGVTEAGRVPENQRFGAGVSTPREMVLLLEKIERGLVVSAEASREMIEILKRQQYKDGIGRKLGDLAVASKSGALDRLRSDVGIVYAPGGPLAIAITCDELPEVDYSADNVGNIFISKLTGVLLEELLPQAR